MADSSYLNVRRMVYEPSGATFVPVCSTCGRFVTADAFLTVYVDWVPGLPQFVIPNATCSKDGRIAMLFEGFY